MALALGGCVLFCAIVISAIAGWRLASGKRRVLSPEREAKRDVLHHASVALPHLRGGLNHRSARRAISHLRALTDAPVLLITDKEQVLAMDGADQVDVDPEIVGLVELVRNRRVHVDHNPPASPGWSAIAAALVVRDDCAGTLIALFPPSYSLEPEDGRVLAEAAALVEAQLELSVMAERDKRLAEAELRALRTRISPHFIYNSLAAIASFIHSRPDEARRLLTEFCEFTRYAFRRERTYVTVADELHYVGKYLSLEQARFGERLTVRVTVAPEVLPVAVPVLSLQPLVENAVRHGVESTGRPGTVEIVGEDLNCEVELRVVDDGAGMDGAAADAALRGDSGGIGVHNVDRRLKGAFGSDYGLRISSAQGRGTTVVMTVPKFQTGVRAA